MLHTKASRALALALTTTIGLCASPSAWAQGSDDCATAQSISGPGPHAFDTTGATTGAQGQLVACGLTGLGIDNDVWFVWTAPATGTVVLSTCGQTTVDTKVAVYAGSGCPAAGALSCSDDDCFLQSQASFDTTAGTTYLLQIGSAPGNPGGTGTFTFHAMPPLTNDSCSTPVVLSGSATVSFDNSLATTGTQGQNNPGCVNVKRDLWYRWTAPATGVANLSLCGLTAVDTAIAVYAGGACPTAFSIACDDDACNLQSATSWPVTGGAVYMLQIGGAGGSSAGIGAFTIDVTGVPANDDCALPITLGGSGASFDTTSATMGSDGQASPCGAIDHDLWYEWVPSASGIATVDTCGQTGVDTMLAVYSGAACPTGASIACDNDGCGAQSSVTFNASAGVHYLIQLGTPPGAPGGPGSFVLTESPPGITPYCDPGLSGVIACPCSNPPSTTGRGCDNSSATGGASISASGAASLGADTLVFSTADETPVATSIVLQGSAADPTGVVFGQGVRCVTGTLLRLYVKSASGGSISAPSGADPTVSASSAALGDTIVGGQNRYYMVYYRDPLVLGGCPPSQTFNGTNALDVPWGP
jgi:hypothetical protein